MKNKGIQRPSNGKLKRADDISIEKRKTDGLTEYSAGNRGKTQEGSAEQVVEEQDTEATDSATAGKSEKLRQDSSGTMSRRPQVLKITDSATTAFRRRDGNKHVSSSSLTSITARRHLPSEFHSSSTAFAFVNRFHSLRGE